MLAMSSGGFIRYDRLEPAALLGDFLHSLYLVLFGRLCLLLMDLKFPGGDLGFLWTRLMVDSRW